MAELDALEAELTEQQQAAQDAATAATAAAAAAAVREAAGAAHEAAAAAAAAAAAVKQLQGELAAAAQRHKEQQQRLKSGVAAAGARGGYSKREWLVILSILRWAHPCRKVLRAVACRNFLRTRPGRKPMPAAAAEAAAAEGGGEMEPVLKKLQVRACPHACAIGGVGATP